MSEIINIHHEIGNKVVRLICGDITEMTTDAIVNAANEHLAHGAGVAGAIVQKGGQIIQEECNAWVRKHGPVPTGSAAVTSAGELEARYVIHAVGPILGSGDEETKLLSATQKALELADELNLRSIAFPAISTGILGFPIELCATIMIRATFAHLNKSDLREIVFCLWDEYSFDVFKREFALQIKS